MTQTQQFENATQAVNVLLQGVQLAQKRGAYELNEAAILAAATTYLTKPQSSDEELDLETTQEEQQVSE